MPNSEYQYDRLYAEHMRVHPWGYALYKPTSTEVLRPGSVGYFGNQGAWTPIVMLDDPASLPEKGLTNLENELEAMPTETCIQWGPKLSKSVTVKSFDGSAGLDAAAAGIPASAKIHVRYQSSSDFGAILVTHGSIQHDRLYYENMFIEWVTKNASKILSSEKYKSDIENYGLVVVTSTYSCSECALNAWHNSKNEVTLGFDVEAANVADLGIRGSCYTGSAGSGWNFYKSTDHTKLAVFIGGLWFSFRKSLFSQKRKISSSTTPTGYRSSSAASGESQILDIAELPEYEVELDLKWRPKESAFPGENDASKDGNED